MLLTGSFKRSVDDKLRLAIPKKFRDLFAAEGDRPPVLYLAPGTDGSLTLYTETALNALAAKLDTASPTEKEVRAFSRLFFSRAESVDIDGQGRIRIPSSLAELASLKSEATLIGVRDRLEIWSTEKWDAYLKTHTTDYDALAEKALETS